MILSRAEAFEVGSLSFRLGGYEELLRLDRELLRFQQRGRDARMVVDADGRYQLEDAGPAAGENA